MPNPIQSLAGATSDSGGAHGPEAALRLQVIRQHGMLDRQAARLDEQTRQIATLAATLRDTDAQATALRQEAATLRQEVADLRASHSWQITGPLRSLRRASWWLGAVLKGTSRPSGNGADTDR